MDRGSSFNLNKVLESESNDPIYDVDGFTYDWKSKPTNPLDIQSTEEN